MPRQPADDVFSSSPTHPSHHNTNNLNPRNPYATAQRNFNLKRSAEAAALPSPPRTRDVKRKHYVEVELSDTEDEEDVQRTPTKANTTRSRRQAVESPEQATPKGRTTRAHNAAASEASPARSVLAAQEEARRSPSPFPYREESPPPLGRGARRSGSKPMMHYVEEASDSDSAESVVAPVTPKRQRAPVTPPPPTRKTRAAARGPIRDSPNNPFLSNSPRYAKKNPMPLQDRETIPYVFRGMKVPRENMRAVRGPHPDPRASPSNSDYSPGAAFVPKLLFPSAAPTSPTPKSRTRVTRAGSPTPRHPQTPATITKPKGVARKLFATEIASASAPAAPEDTKGKAKPLSWAESSTSSSASSSVAEAHGALNAKARALKQGLRKGAMSGSMAMAHTHGPVRADRPAGLLTREDTFGPEGSGATVTVKTKTTVTATTRSASRLGDELAPAAAITTSPRRSPRGPPSARTTAAFAAARQK